MRIMGEQKTPSTPQIADPGPEFHPLHPQVPPYRAYNTLPASIRRLDVVEPVQILRLFPTRCLLETIAKNTHAYDMAAVTRHDRNQIASKPWHDVIAGEIRALGIVIYMGRLLLACGEGLDPLLGELRKNSRAHRGCLSTHVAVSTRQTMRFFLGYATDAKISPIEQRF